MFFFLSVCIFHRFTPAQVAFLGEYAKVMCPVAKAIDVLQGETSVQMGWLIPTINSSQEETAQPSPFLQMLCSSH